MPVRIDPAQDLDLGDLAGGSRELRGRIEPDFPLDGAGFAFPTEDAELAEDGSFELRGLDSGLPDTGWSWDTGRSRDTADTASADTSWQDTASP